MLVDCLFCKIIDGESRSYKVYENEYSFAFLDAFPLARGHTLIVPKRHVTKLEELGSDESEHLFRSLYLLTAKVCRAVGADSSTIAINNGRASGQEIPHLHVHVIPRFPRDGAGPIHSLPWRRPRLGSRELKDIASTIASSIG